MTKTEDCTTLAFSKEIVEPLFCRDVDDFTKYFLSLANIFANQDNGKDKKENIEFFIDSIKYILHEYLSLVLNGKLDPYKMSFGSDEDKKACVGMFREGMMEITMKMMEHGVPFKECEDGRSRIMFDKLKKEFEDGKS